MVGRSLPAAAFAPFNFLIARSSTSSASSAAVQMTKETGMSPEQRLSPAQQYQHAKQDIFTQEMPQLHNPFLDDPLLARILKRWMPDKTYEMVADDLQRFGDRVVNEIDALGRQAEEVQPRLEQFDAWGNRVDRLITCPAWQRLKQIGAEEGLLALGYEGRHGSAWDRMHQCAKLFIFSPSAAMTTCPIAAGDGAAKAIKELGWSTKTNSSAAEGFRNLTSRNPLTAWTSGQWMTEKRGGSDVANACDTYAVHGHGDMYYLNGYKWFSSATDSEMSLALARVVDANGKAIPGSKGLTLFYVPMLLANGSRNGIQISKLKNKLGTRQLPTGELLLDGCQAYKLSEEGRGVPAISNMLNLTRIHNAISAVAGMRRVISMARDYATKRQAFGQTLDKKPLHMLTLARMETETRACQLLLFEAVRLLGTEEAGEANDEQKLLLRLLTPILKMYTGKMCIPLISEGLECFGGQGYIEDTGLPALLRDGQIYPIWEGTTNINSLDVLRVYAHAPQTWGVYEKVVIDKLGKKETRLEGCRSAVMKGMDLLSGIFSRNGHFELPKASTKMNERFARDLAFAIARLYAGSLMVEQARSKESDDTDIDAAIRYCTENALVDERIFNKDFMLNEENTQKDFQLVYKNYSRSSKL